MQARGSEGRERRVKHAWKQCTGWDERRVEGGVKRACERRRWRERDQSGRLVVSQNVGTRASTEYYDTVPGAYCTDCIPVEIYDAMQ